MGKPTPSAADLASQVVTATLSAVGQTSAPAAFSGRFILAIGGTFVATLVPECSFDGGATWLPLTSLGNAITFTARAVEVMSCPEPGVLFRMRCSAHTSGAAEIRISQ
ncbi:hypothetical protein [Thermaurantiacus tibetensis]|uniref:hypothetical protein n=1 Tax=Thermaurantiacus tibetensis TaxID=2759035 RepID=UPI00188F32B1|nr:hypothetical protein [Thermaurantiacus tibetensis]